MKTVKIKKSRLFLNAIAFLLCLFVGYASSKQLPGEIYPSNVELEVGGSVNITCRLNPHILKGYNASDLRFFNEDTQMPIPEEDIVILNATTIMYMLRNAKEQLTSLVCKCGNHGIQISKIYVGYKPLPVKDFTCRSYDFEYMICNYTQPFNHIMTSYNLSYYMDTPQYKFYPNCNYENKPHIVCNDTVRNQAQYYFVLHGSNELGNSIDNFTFNNWEIMSPAKPGEQLRQVSLSDNSLGISWRMPKWDKYRPKGLRWEILLKPENLALRNLSELVNVSKVRGEMHLSLFNLPYAWYWYDLKIRVRINLPNTPWSEYLTYRFRTKAKRPERAPLVKAGSFYIDSTETQVRIYWEQLEEYEQNGNHFSYIISSVKQDGEITQQEPLRMEANCATFAWHKNSKYEFEIQSSNDIGKSLNATRLIIHPLANRNVNRYTPRAIQNVYHATNGTYTLTWQQPIELAGLIDYTVYWCYSKRALQNECKGSIHFVNVPADVLEFTTSPQSTQQDHTLNLAVSANFIDYNTGMHWTDCTQDVNSDLVKMEPEVQALNGTSIKIQWTPERICPSILIGYNISYCELFTTSNNGLECLKAPHIVSINNNAKKYELTELKPYTLYKIGMFMYSHSKVGKLSDAQIVRTHESAPTPPRQLQLLHVGNTSATITWLPPSHPNGKINYYTISINNKKIILNVPDFKFAEINEKLTFNLTQLSSFTTYKVYVTAHNLFASDPSNDINFTTLIGIPSAPGTVSPQRDNNTIIQWSKPKTASGRIEYYEVLITQFHNDERIKSHINIVISQTFCVLRQLPVCASADYKTTVQVRAVNAAFLAHEVDLSNVEDAEYREPDYEYDDQAEDFLHCDSSSPKAKQYNDQIQQYQNKQLYRLYKSEWQLGSTYSCSANRYSRITTLALLTIILICGFVAAGYFAGKKYKKMANIHCTLPEGLESYYEKDLYSNNSSSAAILSNETLGYNHTDYVKQALNDFHLENNQNGETIEENQQTGNPFTMRNEQEQHLLQAGACNDSGYLGDLRCLESFQFLQAAKEKKQCNELSLQHSRCVSADSLVDDSRLSLSEEDDKQLTTNKASDNGYINAENLHEWSKQQAAQLAATQPPLQAQLTPNLNGYITVEAIKEIERKPEPPHTQPPTNMGYIHPSQLQQLTLNHEQNEAINNANKNANNFNGYTSLAEIEHVMRNTPNLMPNISQVQPRAVGTAATQISGYVTQQDLNMFAKKQNPTNAQQDQVFPQF